MAPIPHMRLQPQILALLTCVSISLPAITEKPTKEATSLKAERHLSAAIKLSISFFWVMRGVRFV